MASVVPQPNDWLREGVFVAQRTETRRAQQEVSTHRGIESEPTSGEDSQKMPAGEQQHVPCDGARALQRAIGSRANLVRRFPARAAIAKQLPIRTLPMDVSSTPPLIRAIVPF